MMSLLLTIALLGLLGYVLGIAGFFRAGAALDEVRALRLELGEELRRHIVEASEGSAEPNPSPNADPVVSAAYEKAEPALDQSVPLQPEVTNSSIAADSAEEAAAADPDAASDHPNLDLESVLTMRWAVWLGAVALLLAGVFLVRYASDQGLLGPATRCAAAAALGVALLAGATWVQHRPLPSIPGPFDADQTPPALAAGGVAVLFGAAYGLGPFYGLLSGSAAFAAMAGVACIGLGASLLFGPLTAAIGIAGAFATPALVSAASPSLVGLFVYLTCATAAANAVIRRTAWVWLGWVVSLAGAAWVFAAAQLPHDPELWAAAAFVPVAALLGLLLPAVAMTVDAGRALAWGQFAIIATAGLALEVAAPGLDTRAAVFALMPLAIWKAADEPRLDRLPWLAAAVGMVALWLWNGPVTPPPTVIGWPSPPVSTYDDHVSLLATAFAFALLNAVAGLIGERRAAHPVRWSALVAAIPVLTLAVAYARVGRFEADPRWGLAGLVLTVLLVMAARRAMDRGASDCAGAHAAGTVAALALAFAMVLRQQWLGTALALIIPGLAWVEARTKLEALRVVAAVVTALVFALIPGWLLHDVAVGHPSTAGNPFTAYAIPAAAFVVAARLFRRGGDGRLVAALEAGAVATTALFLIVEVRLRFGEGLLDAGLTFDEAATLMLTAAAQAMAYDFAGRRTGRRTAGVARRALGGAAILIAVGLLVCNPLLTNAKVGAVSLTFGYLLPALIAAYVGWTRPQEVEARWLSGYALLAGFAWVTLLVRLAFHPGALGFGSGRTQAELWLLSAAWLAYGLVLMAAGLRLGARQLRLAALVLIALVSGKVFLVDMGELAGLLRVASFLGLGLVLIGLAAVHRRFVLAGSNT